MPSALETLVKILKLEREQGCRNSAVIGGLGAYSDNWLMQAQQQARRPEHQILAEEIVELLRNYEDAAKTERLHQINYILDRITGRAPVPERFEQRLEELKQQTSRQSEQREQRPQQERSPRRERRERSEREPNRENGERRGERRPRQQRLFKGTDTGGEYDASFAPAELSRGLDIKPLPRLTRPPRRPRPNWTTEQAREALKALDNPVTVVKGVGPGMAHKLSEAGLETIRDLLNYLPRRYDDYTRLTHIKDLEPDTVATVIGKITHVENRVGRNNRRDFFIVLDDGSAPLNVTFFGMHYLNRRLKPGMQVVLSGKVTAFRQRLQMSNPEWETLEAENLHTIGIVPVYPLTESLKARSFRQTMKKTVDQWAEKVPDPVPEATLDRCELADLGWTYKNLHFPEGHDHLAHAKRRFIFDELLHLQLAILGYRREWQREPVEPLEVSDDFIESFIQAVFPYDLTGAQQRAVADIRRDVGLTLPMNRLIQGDVGSGKTAVATVGMAMAFANGRQAALMAPTSVLAEQHYRGIGQTLALTPGEQKPVVALLTSALSTTEREAIYSGLADGSIDIVIGTHALIQQNVTFKDLAFAVIDEQHRFGVEQRGALRDKGDRPHLLVMTATPIPRTLALTMYADLDLTIIDEKPPGRQPVETMMLYPTERERALSFIDGQIKQGRQAFVIHPLVEASEKVEARSAVEAYEELSQIFRHHRVCLLHGRMKPAEKDAIMGAFANHEYDIMVTTSVAEVGVDVPNASVILIEGANRFGLAQLHQFRGRVGRGQFQSYCFLIPDAEGGDAAERLKAMEDTDDGFKLAEIDWQLRGAGDMLGTRQSGGHRLQLLEEMTPELVELSQREARTIYEIDPDLEQDQHALLAAQVQRLRQDPGDLS